MSNKARRNLKLQHPADAAWTTVVFDTCLQRAHQIEDTILSACREHHFADHDLFALKLALEEALVNAVKHGNQNDPCKKVTVQYRVNDARVDVSIEDQGPGFNPAELPDPTSAEHLEDSHGRGILLMRAYMNNVVYSPNGTRVTLTKFNEGAHETTAHRLALG